MSVPQSYSIISVTTVIYCHLSLRICHPNILFWSIELFKDFTRESHLVANGYWMPSKHSHDWIDESKKRKLLVYSRLYKEFLHPVKNFQQTVKRLDGSFDIIH